MKPLKPSPVLAGFAPPEPLKMGERRCNLCGKGKPLEEFYRAGRHKATWSASEVTGQVTHADVTARAALCKTCHSERQRRYYAKKKAQS